MRALVALETSAHLIARELPGEGLKALCGGLSSQLPLDRHTFTTCPDRVTCPDCRTAWLIWANTASITGARR